MNLKGWNQRIQMEARNEQAPKEGGHTMSSHEEKKQLEAALTQDRPWKKCGPTRVNVSGEPCAMTKA
jgi:tRNA(Arg) A34 adenosine deaminase TadA